MNDYNEMTPEVSKELFLTTPLSSSKAVRGSETNREADMQRLVTERIGKLRDCILKSR